MTDSTPRTAPWLLVLCISLVFVGATDLYFLARAKAFLSSGYNSYALSGARQVVTFLLVAAVCDVALLLVLWLGLRPALSRLRKRPLQHLLLTAALAALVPLGANFLLYRVHEVLGNLLALDALLQLAGGDTLGAAQEALATTSAAMLAVGALGVVGGLGAASWWIDRHFGEGRVQPKSHHVGAAALVAVGAGLVALVWCDRHAPAFAHGLRWKASGMALRALGSRLTDVDLDGAGLLSRPPDFAPFDGTRYPFAPEVPGNGLDENGLAGDLPVGARGPSVFGAGRSLVPGGPSLVLVFLETFRGDLIDASLRGRPVAPNLMRLASEGASSRQMFTHSAMTWDARAQLLQGTMVPRLGQTTLVDDFREAGYEVAWFSGQHDGPEAGGSLLGVDRADVFRDGRSDMGERTTPSARPISLQVSWKTVLASATAFLAERSSDRPLFLYVNFVDTHFPYDHEDLDGILGTQRITRADISRENGELVWEAYLNAAANVDRAIGRLLEAVDHALGPGSYALVVTADHGEAFYEDGFLGHGQSLDRVQSGVPLVVRGLGGRWPEPLGLADLRGLLATHLPEASGTGGPTFTPEPTRRIFQYMGSISRPNEIALRGTDGVVALDLRDEAPKVPPEGFEALVRAWEALRLEAEAR